MKKSLFYFLLVLVASLMVACSEKDSNVQIETSASSEGETKAGEEKAQHQI